MKIWIYKDGAQQGPFDPSELPALGIGPDTKVWFSGMPKWVAAAEVPELQGLFGAPQPPATPAEALHPDYLTDEPQTETTQNCDEPQPEQSEGYEPQGYEPQGGYEYCTCEVPKAPAPASEPCPPSYLAWSIVLTVLCCSPLSIAAIITSVYTGVYYRRGDMHNARRASEATAWLIMISIALGALPSMIFTLMF